MLRNKIGPVFNARNVVFFCFLFLLFFLSSSFCRENEIFKNKKTKKNKKLDQFLTLEKAKIGPVFNSTASLCYAENAWRNRGDPNKNGFVWLPRTPSKWQPPWNTTGRSRIARPYPHCGWAERPRKGSQSFSWNSPREHGWDPQTL